MHFRHTQGVQSKHPTLAFTVAVWSTLNHFYLAGVKGFNKTFIEPLLCREDLAISTIYCHSHWAYVRWSSQNFSLDTLR